MSTNYDSVYNCYRSKLNSLKKAGYRHSAQRKQEALKTASDRYALPVSEVKNIVRIAETGSKSEDSRNSDFLHNREIEKLTTLLADTEAKSNGICEKCETNSESAIVRARILNPEESDLRKIRVSALCFDCFYNSVESMDSHDDFLNRNAPLKNKF